MVSQLGISPLGRDILAQGVSPGSGAERRREPYRGDTRNVTGVACVAPVGLLAGGGDQPRAPLCSALGWVCVAPAGLKRHRSKAHVSPVQRRSGDSSPDISGRNSPAPASAKKPALPVSLLPGNGRSPIQASGLLFCTVYHPAILAGLTSCSPLASKLCWGLAQVWWGGSSGTAHREKVGS